MYCINCGKKFEGNGKLCDKCSSLEDFEEQKKDIKVHIIVLKIIGVIISAILAFGIGIGVFFGFTKIKKSLYPNDNNIVMELKDNKKKEIYIEESEIKTKVDELMQKISSHYPKAKINQVNEIKLIYNYKEKIIEYVYLYVNLDRYYMIYSDNGSFGVASVVASMTRNGVYTDGWKVKNGDNKLIFDINNLNSDWGLVTSENNQILVKIKDELNKGRDNTFYWQKKVY